MDKNTINKILLHYQSMWIGIILHIATVKAKRILRFCWDMRNPMWGNVMWYNSAA